MIPKCASWKQQTLSHRFCELKIWEQPSRVVVVQGVSWGCSQDAGHDRSYLKADCAGRSDSKMAPAYSPFGRGLNSLLAIGKRLWFLTTWNVHGAAWLSPWHGSLLPPEWMIQKQTIQYLLRPSLRTYRQSLLPKLFVRHELLSPVYTQGEWN